MDKLEERAREWLIEWNNKQALHPSQDKCIASLTALLTEVQAEAWLAAIDEIARFAETHYCIIDENSLGGYKVCERTKHPNEPFAKAIRGMAALEAQAAHPSAGGKVMREQFVSREEFNNSIADEAAQSYVDWSD